ncbi:MAG: hypothetical protein KBD67_04965 [Anaerolineaceae bacterium]|nr:hypothetical protein [Anaerolineaceae bacterium]
MVTGCKAAAFCVTVAAALPVAKGDAAAVCVDASSTVSIAGRGVSRVFVQLLMIKIISSR